MTDIEKLLQKVCADALVQFSKDTKCGLCDRHKGQLLYDIDGQTYVISITQQKE